MHPLGDLPTVWSFENIHSGCNIGSGVVKANLRKEGAISGRGPTGVELEYQLRSSVISIRDVRRYNLVQVCSTQFLCYASIQG